MVLARLTRFHYRLIPKADRKKIHEYLFRGKHRNFSKKKKKQGFVALANCGPLQRVFSWPRRTLIYPSTAKSTPKTSM